MRDVAVPEVLLNRPSVLSVVRELVAAGMTEHVRVRRAIVEQRRDWNLREQKETLP
jgi:hypothetical protein